ncbi:hypothetical protein DAQ1742_04372 [Dickeya aquatica]|uniref:Uncharacterized protein n=1 Tax=Dickeya aquatica TaxID=1401087 RepID=A0A375AGH8_9GAMM|nr:hypothetical protein DAQ1742_04372 [Dickeya aquatica]
MLVLMKAVMARRSSAEIIPRMACDATGDGTSLRVRAD